MRTVAGDLTAAARIRRAAIARFGRQGFEVGLRAIADDAGVSLGLIRHHFGSKDGLRAACDEEVLREIRTAKEGQFLDRDPAAAMLHELAHVENRAPLWRYLVQTMRTGGPLAKTFFERMVEDAVDYTERAVASGVIVPSRDPIARARFLTAVALGGALITEALDGRDDPQSSLRTWLDEMTLPALELYTQGLLTDSSLLEGYLEQLPDAPETATRPTTAHPQEQP